MTETAAYYATPAARRVSAQQRRGQIDLVNLDPSPGADNAWERWCDSAETVANSLAGQPIVTTDGTVIWSDGDLIDQNDLRPLTRGAGPNDPAGIGSRRCGAFASKALRKGLISIVVDAEGNEVTTTSTDTESGNDGKLMSVWRINWAVWNAHKIAERERATRARTKAASATRRIATDRPRLYASLPATPPAVPVGAPDAPAEDDGWDDGLFAMPATQPSGLH